MLRQPAFAGDGAAGHNTFSGVGLTTATMKLLPLHLRMVSHPSTRHATASKSYPKSPRKDAKVRPPLPPISASSRETGGSNGGSSILAGLNSFGEPLSTGFPLWVASACLYGLFRPAAFDWIHKKCQILGITLTMLGLLDGHDTHAMPKELISGFFLQCWIMPLSSFFGSKILNLPSHYAAGLILVACCPAGTASNIVTYLAQGNVALSVVMTAASTFSAVIMTHYLPAKLAGQYVNVDAAGLFFSTVQVVLAPVLVGAFLNQYFPRLVKNSAAILMSRQQVILAVCMLHASGFFFGYIFSWFLGLNVSSLLTTSSEVGMLNSVLGIVLATQHSSNPLSAVLCAVSSVCHSIYGSVLAGIWRFLPAEKQLL